MEKDWEKIFAGKVMAGVDEAGRGPLAGPVVAGAVVLPREYDLPGLADSKKLTEKQREELEVLIKKQAVSWAVASATHKEIDELNILAASRLAMRRAVLKLKVKPEVLLIDATTVNLHELVQVSIVKGDARCACISAASILAKVERDRQMKKYAEKFPGYGFEVHMGYGTERHYFALETLGVCEIHRKTFKLSK